MTHIGAAIIAFLGIAVWVVGSVMVNGYVFSVLWTWFAVPQFHVSPLSLPGAMGISLLVKFLTGNIPTKKEETDIGYMMAVSCAWYGTALLCGWILSHWM